jgi:hypothetical protein
MKKPILIVLLILPVFVINAQNDNDEWYRFQLTGFAGYAHNFGKPHLPPDYSYSGPDGSWSVNYAGAKEIGAFSYGTSFLAFPSFFRFNRFCIAAGAGSLQLNTLVASDSIVQEWNITSPPPAIGRSVLYDVRWNVQEQFVQFPVLLRAYLIRKGRFVTHSDIGFVPSLLLNRVENYFTADTYKKTFFGTSFYTADLNISYRIKSSNKYGFFITAGVVTQMAVTETQQQRRPGMIGGLLGLRFDAY